ncbi:MAG: hypothetical protein F6K56_18745 [Moorea sp. SIO3G5]|nr:hypothetical protein [Moorena sp. SIO3G5]
MITINFSTEKFRFYHCSLFPVPCSLPLQVNFKLGARCRFSNDFPLSDGG